MSLSGDKGVAQFKKSVKMGHPSIKPGFCIFLSIICVTHLKSDVNHDWYTMGMCEAFWIFFVPLCSVLLSFHGFHTCAKPPVVERKLWVADVGWGGHRLCLQYWPPKLATCVVFFACSYKLLVKPLRHPKRKYCKNHLYPVLKDTVCVCSIGLPSSQPASLFLRVPQKLLVSLPAN